MDLIPLGLLLGMLCLTLWKCIRIRKKIKRGWKLRDYYDRYEEDFREERRKF